MSLGESPGFVCPVFRPGSDFEGADLRFTDFTRSGLFNCNFTHADLQFANLEEAHVGAADFTGALFDQTVLPNGSIRFAERQ